MMIQSRSCVSRAVMGGFPVSLLSGGEVIIVLCVLFLQGALHATKNVSFEVPDGQIRAIIGPNGAGKSTLMDLITNRTTPSSGKVYHLIARRPLPQFTSSTVDRSELRLLRVNREGMNCLRMYLPYL